MKKIIDTMRNYGFSNEVIASVLGNIKVECDFKLQAENMYYSKAETLMRNFPSKFKGMSVSEIETYTKNPEKLGNFVYSDIGKFRYRGRGYIQITGIANYKDYSDVLKIDLVSNPDLALREDIAILIVIEYIKKVAIAKYPSLNGVRDIKTVADIITKSIQGFGKDYSKGFLKEHLQKKRNYAIQYFKELEINEVIGGK